MRSARVPGSPWNSTAMPDISTRALRRPASRVQARNASTGGGAGRTGSAKTLLRKALSYHLDRTKSPPQRPSSGESRRAGTVQAHDRVSAEGGPAGGDPQARRGGARRKKAPGPPRRDRQRQDL